MEPAGSDQAWIENRGSIARLVPAALENHSVRFSLARGVPATLENDSIGFTVTCLESAYLPMQNLENISPSKSSEVNSPVISPRARWACRKSSAMISPG